MRGVGQQWHSTTTTNWLTDGLRLGICSISTGMLCWLSSEKKPGEVLKLHISVLCQPTMSYALRTNSSPKCWDASQTAHCILSRQHDAEKLGSQVASAFMPSKSLILYISQPPNQHGTILAVTSTSEWRDCFWECILISTGNLSPLFVSMNTIHTLQRQSCSRKGAWQEIIWWLRR